MGSAWQMERGAEFTFRVRFWGAAARYVRETQFHPSQEVRELADGSVLFTAKACGIKSVARWVLESGSEAVVIEPIELREYMANELRGALVKYDEKFDSEHLFNDIL